MRILFVIVMCIVGVSCDGTTGNDKRGNSPNMTGPEAGKDSLKPHYNCASYKKSNIAPNSGQGLFHTELSSTNLEEAYCLYPERRKEALNFLLKNTKELHQTTPKMITAQVFEILLFGLKLL